MKDKTLEELLEIACPDLREITFHTDGRVIAKTGGRAKFPKKLYSSKYGSWADKTKDTLIKLIEENI